VRLEDEPLWALSLYRQAREGGGSLVVRREVEPKGGPPDLARSAAEGARRARGKLRRYCASNVLNRFGTLTYADACFDPLLLRADLAGFFRDLRGSLGGEAFPYVWVPEWHPGGHGLHAHVAFGRYVPRGKIEEAWDRGFIKIKLIGDLPVGAGALGEARRVASYMAKYVSKTFEDDGRIPGLHRYEVAQGFQPEKTLVYGASADDVIARASGLLGAAPQRVWLSSSVEGWRGPPACWAQWA
jgi:hypothetical protein